MQYVKSLDGVRATAVFLVMLFHFGYLPLGWIGVQIFFTLSGYLITCILLNDRGSSFFAYAGRFYWRRSLRIFPLFYVFLLVVAVLFALSGIPASFPSDLPWLFTYTANFARMRNGDLGPWSVHIWSLALEEQFYLIWPLLLFFLSAQRLRWAITCLLLFTPVIRLALFQWMLSLGHSTEYAGIAAYVLPFTQFDAFAAGAAIPLWGLDRIRNAGRWFLVALGVTAVAGVGVLAKAHFLDGGAFLSSFGYAMGLRQSYGYVWGYTLLNVLSMLGIICVLQGVGPLRVLENALLVHVGRISYGVYVYHLPLLSAGEFLLKYMGIDLHGGIRFAFFATWVAVVMLLSGASFRWLETPFLKLKNSQRRFA